MMFKKNIMDNIKRLEFKIDYLERKLYQADAKIKKICSYNGYHFYIQDKNLSYFKKCQKCDKWISITKQEYHEGKLNELN